MPSQDLLGRTPLHKKAYDPKGMTEKQFSDFIATHKGSINLGASKQSDHTPLHFACYGSSNAMVVNKLIAAGANPLQKDIMKRYPLHLAANCADPEILKILLDKDRIGLKNKDIEYQQYLKHLDTDGKNVFHALCSSGSSDDEKSREDALVTSFTLLEKKLLEEKISPEQLLTQPDREGITPAMYAKFYGFTELAPCFEKYGIDLNEITPSQNLASQEHPDYFGRLAIHSMAFAGQKPKLLEMLANKPENLVHRKKLNTPNTQAGGRIPLHLACCGIQDDEVVTAILDIMVQQKMPVMQTCLEGCTPLHYAAYSGRMDIVEAIFDTLKKHENLNLTDKELTSIVGAQDIYGRTALDCVQLAGNRPEQRVQITNLLKQYTPTEEEAAAAQNAPPVLFSLSQAEADVSADAAPAPSAAEDAKRKAKSPQQA